MARLFSVIDIRFRHINCLNGSLFSTKETNTNQSDKFPWQILTNSLLSVRPDWKQLRTDVFKLIFCNKHRKIYVALAARFCIMLVRKTEMKNNLKLFKSNEVASHNLQISLDCISWSSTHLMEYYELSSCWIAHPVDNADMHWGLIE